MERPRRVVRLESDSILQFENLVKGTRSLMHCSYIKHYADADLHQTVELVELVELEKISEFLEHEVFTVQKFCDLRKNAEEMTWEVLCAWRGFADEESTWEPVAVMKMDTPEFF
jgi:hypothetical protein